MTTLNYVVTTGDFIAEWMEEEGINAAELARRLDVTPKHVSELLSGKAPLSHSLALGLERVTGVPARIWNLYESGYRGELARAAADVELASQYEAAKAFPLAYLRKFGFIKAPARDRAGTVRELLALLGVASLDAFQTTWSRGSVAYRRSAVGRDKAPALAVWLRLAEQHADGLRDLPAFDGAGLEALISEIRRLTVGDPVAGIQDAIARLRGVGVVLCLNPPVPGLRVHGATRWLNGHPVIQLSLLMRSDDQLWFTLFHELGHVLLHSDQELFLFGEATEAEHQADGFAADVLVPQDYRDRLPRRRDLAAVRSLAAELGIAPSIVLGQAQRLTEDYAWGHALKVKLEWLTPPQQGSGRDSGQLR
jgi:HTH-type transcriptional regulator/antitoxin HigA